MIASVSYNCSSRMKVVLHESRRPASGLATLRQKGHTWATTSCLLRFWPSSVSHALQTPVDDYPRCLCSGIARNVRPVCRRRRCRRSQTSSFSSSPCLKRRLVAKPKLATGVPLWRIPQLRIPGQVSDQNNFIEPRQRWLLCGWWLMGVSGRSRLLAQFHREELDDGVFKPIGAF